MIVNPYPEKTIHYKTWLKTTLQESMNSIFALHPDSFLSKVKVTLDKPKSEAEYPAVIIRYYESRVERTGLFNTVYQSYLINGKQSPLMTQETFFYWGTVEYAIIAQTSYDRDVISDTIVQIVMASELEKWANSFRARIYTIDDQSLDTELNFIYLNHGHVMGFGETDGPVDWQEEDEKFYRALHRTEVFGEFITPPDVPVKYIESYTLYPYVDYSLGPTEVPSFIDSSGYAGSPTTPPPFLSP